MADFTEDARIVAAAASNADEPEHADAAEAVAAATASIREIIADSTDDIVATVSALVREKPLTALALAAGAGYVLSRLRS